MILPDLIETHGNVIVKREKTRWGFQEGKSFPPGIKKELINIVIDWFKSQGWVTKFKERSGEYVSRMPKHHTKISWEIGDGHGNVYGRAKLHSKTPNGGWTVAVRRYHAGGRLGDLVKKAGNIPAPTLITKETLPALIPLGTQETTIKHDHGVSCISKWRHVRIYGVVGLKKDGTIDQQKAYAPDEVPWFHCRVNDHNGASAHIITDGDSFHPLNPRRYKGEEKYRVTTNVPPCVKNTTVGDQELLALAISTLFDG